MKSTNIRFVENRHVFYIISVILVIASFVLLFTKGLNYGIDFKGGNILHVTFEKDTNENEIRGVFKKISESNKLNLAVDHIMIQNVASGIKEREYIIQYPATSKDSIEANTINEKIMSGLYLEIAYSKDNLEVAYIGPTIGDEMKEKGFIAALLSCIGILLYLAYRFDFASSAGVVLAVVHDLIVSLGFVSLLGIEFDTTVLVALLTLLGSSVNDSIVIFDRVRENSRISKNGTAYIDIVNSSINQSLSRTLNTTITTLLALLALVLYGGDSIYGFSITLTFGSIIGTYSSICIASTCVLDIFGKTKVYKKAEGMVPVAN